MTLRGCSRRAQEKTFDFGGITPHRHRKAQNVNFCSKEQVNQGTQALLHLALERSALLVLILILLLLLVLLLLLLLAVSGGAALILLVLLVLDLAEQHSHAAASGGHGSRGRTALLEELDELGGGASGELGDRLTFVPRGTPSATSRATGVGLIETGTGRAAGEGGAEAANAGDVPASAGAAVVVVRLGGELLKSDQRKTLRNLERAVRTRAASSRWACCSSGERLQRGPPGRGIFLTGLPCSQS